MTNEGKDRVRAEKLEIQNFRAFPAKRDMQTNEPRPFELDFKADVVLVSGPNGVGKTSLADALNVTLNRSPFDARVLWERGEARAVWRNGGDGHVRLNSDPRVDAKELGEPKGKPAGTPLAAFATVFYQADPTFRLDEYASRARANAPSWIDQVRSQLDQVAASIRKKVASYQPRNVPSKDEESARRDAITKKMYIACDGGEDGRLKDEVNKVFRNNGTVRADWRCALAGVVDMPGAQPYDALEELAKRIGDDIAKRQPKPAAAEARLHRAPPWPNVTGRDLVLRFIRKGDSGRLETIGDEWLVPIGNAGAAQMLRRWAAEEKARAKARQTAITELAPAVERVRPREGAASFEERLLSLASEAGAWLDAAKALEVHVPERMREVVAQLAEERETLNREAMQFRHDAAAKVEQRRTEFREAGQSVHRADEVEAAVLLGEAIAEDEVALRRIEEILDGREVIRLAELRSAYEQKRGTEERVVERVEGDDAKRETVLLAAVREWARFEREAEQWERERQGAEAYIEANKAAEPYLKVVDELKRRNGLLDAPPLSAEELEKISKLANQVLEITALGRKWRIDVSAKRQEVELWFESWDDASSRVQFPNLSTGQRTLVCIALALAFNLLAEDIIQHDVLVFDDIGTALDLAQLPALAFILRGLAYAPAGLPGRQIVLASHHEDMTTRFIDLLAPPPGQNRSLLVHAFEEWGLDEGPSIATYEYSEGPIGESGLEDEEEAKAMFAALVNKGVMWIEQRY